MVDIEKSLYDEILDFCKINEISDINDFINKTLRKGFNLKKYGESFALFFNKKEEDMIFEGPPIEKSVELAIEKLIVKEEPKKKSSKKKKTEQSIVKEEELTKEEKTEQTKEPIYDIKQEDPKPVKKPVTLVKKKSIDNYDVYDEI